MKNKILRNALISGVLAVLSGVVLFGASAAFGNNPVGTPPGDGVSPTFTGLNVEGGDVMVTGGGLYAEGGVSAPSGFFSDITHKNSDEALTINEDLSVVRNIEAGRHVDAAGNISSEKTINADDGFFSGDQIRIFDGDLSDYKDLKNAEDNLGIARKTGAVIDPEPFSNQFGELTKMDMHSMLWNFVGPVKVNGPFPFSAYLAYLDGLTVKAIAIFEGPAGFQSGAFFDDTVSISDADGDGDAKLVVDKIESSNSDTGLLFDTKIKGPNDKLSVKGDIFADHFGDIYTVGAAKRHVVQESNKSITVECDNPNDVMLSCNLQTVSIATANVYSITYPTQSKCKMDYREIPTPPEEAGVTMNSYLVGRCWDMNGDGPVANNSRFPIVWDFSPGAFDFDQPLDDSVDFTFRDFYDAEGPVGADPFDEAVVNDFVDPLWDPIPEGSMGEQQMGNGFN